MSYRTNDHRHHVCGIGIGNCRNGELLRLAYFVPDFRCDYYYYTMKEWIFYMIIDTHTQMNNYTLRNLTLLLILIPTIVSQPNPTSSPTPLFPLQADQSALTLRSLFLSLSLTITTPNKTLIYPIPPSHYLSLQQCGAIPTLKLVPEQEFVIESSRPIVVTVESDDGQIVATGYGRSRKVEVPVGERGNMGQELAVHETRVIVMRQCQNYFSTQHFNLLLKVRPQPQQPQQSSPQHFIKQPLTLHLPSFTYCLEQLQLSSLQAIFDTLYTILIAIVVSMLPTFALVRGWAFGVLVVGMVVGAQLWREGEAVCLLIAGMFVVRSNNMIRTYQLQVQQQKLHKLSKTSLISLLLFYFVTTTITSMSHPTPILQNLTYGNVSLVYIFALYAKNITMGLLTVQMLGSVFWVNRVRGVFWGVVGGFGVVLWRRGGYNTVPLLQQSSFSIVLPSIFAQSCHFHSLLPLLLLTPICHFLDKFNKLKFGCLLVLTTVAIIGSYSSEYWAFVVGVVEIGVWMAIAVGAEGVEEVFGWRWLRGREMRALG